jgi:lysozyme
MIDLRLRKLLIRHEDLRQKPYLDCCGKYWRLCSCREKGRLTIGVGRNLDDNGVSFEEAIALLENDVVKAHEYAEKHFPWYKSLTPARKAVIISMIFNMGMGGILSFKKFLGDMIAQDYVCAAAELRDSKWATQVGERAEELADLMERGEWEPSGSGAV